MTKRERKLLGEIQNLVGRAKGCYQNDRDPNRAISVTQPLERAFLLCVELLSAYPADKVKP